MVNHKCKLDPNEIFRKTGLDLFFRILHSSSLFRYGPIDRGWAIETIFLFPVVVHSWYDLTRPRRDPEARKREERKKGENQITRTFDGRKNTRRGQSRVCPEGRIGPFVCANESSSEGGPTEGLRVTRWVCTGPRESWHRRETSVFQTFPLWEENTLLNLPPLLYSTLTI